MASAAFIGAVVGLALGAAYLGGGMSRAAADHARAQRIAQTAGGGFSEAALRREAGADPAVIALAQPHDPFAPQSAATAVSTAQLVKAQAQISRARELDCLAQAVYFEARGESARGQAAVATVIMNRVKNPNFPKTVCGVVYQGVGHHNGCQFSFACDGSSERVLEWTAWERARQVAARVLSGAVLRDVGSATHYHTIDVDPEWGSHMLRVSQVGLHIFYRFNPHAQPRLDDADDPPQFASRAVRVQPQLRLAAALTAPAEDAAKPAPAAPEPRPAAKPDAPGPIAQSDAPATADATATS